MKTSLFILTAMTGLLLTGSAFAEKKNFVVQQDNEGGELTGDNELPKPVNTAASGTAAFTYDTDTKKLCGKIEFQPSTFAYTQAHFHEGSATTENGEVYVTLAGDPGEGTINVNQVLTATQDTKLTTGDTYVNVHTTANTGGELRGQLVEDSTATAVDCIEVDAGASSSSSSSSSSSGSADAGPTTTTTPDSTTDDGGCNTSGSSSSTNALFVLAGIGAVFAATRRRKSNKA